MSFRFRRTTYLCHMEQKPPTRDGSFFDVYGSSCTISGEHRSGSTSVSLNWRPIGKVRSVPHEICSNIFRSRLFPSERGIRHKVCSCILFFCAEINSLFSCRSRILRIPTYSAETNPTSGASQWYYHDSCGRVRASINLDEDCVHPQACYSSGR